MTKKLVAKSQLPEKGITLSHSQIHKLIKAGQFPKPFDVGGRERVWLESELDEWIDRCAAARQAGVA